MSFLNCFSCSTGKSRKKEGRRRGIRRKKSVNASAPQITATFNGRRISSLSDDTEYLSADEESLSGVSTTSHPHERHHNTEAEHMNKVNGVAGHKLASEHVFEEDADDNVIEEHGNVVVLQPVENGHGCANLLHMNSQHSKKRLVRSFKPTAGASMKRKTSRAGVEDSGVRECFEQPDAMKFNVRGTDYMRTKKKVPSDAQIMTLLGIDVFATDFKIYHIARHVELPAAPQISKEAQELGIPPLLIVNLQCPLYNPPMFNGTNDGKGGSLIYYFSLPENWTPDQVDNKAALNLFLKFIRDERLDDGLPARDRLKLIPRVANVDEWAKVAPLTVTEHRLLTSYNDKPLLTRPQQKFYRGHNYLEVDLDVHCWNFIARKAFFGYIPRLASVVFENAFVVQGNKPEELPELVLACVRVYRVDFDKVKPFPFKPEEDVNPPDV